jgi:fido (protein-threonine AMPylation protein)
VLVSRTVLLVQSPLSISKISTTVLLSQWEKGSADAERLCADLLRTDGFDDVDPQHPLGGPDGGKDILCVKDGNAFVAAAYFTRQPVSFAATKKKFKSDLESSLKHDCGGFIFLTNQHLEASERGTLEKLAAASGKRCLIYHRERLRVMLDTPSGYGVRLTHLAVAMSNEEQAAFFAVSGQSVTEALRAQTRAIDELSQRVLRMARESMGFVAHSAAVVMDAVRDREGHTDVSSMLKAAAEKGFHRIVEDPTNAISARLTSPLLRYIHRLLLPTDPAFAGKFRETQVWLVNAQGHPNLNTECPAWDKVPTLVDELLDEWNLNFSCLIGDSEAVIPAMARFFQRLSWIHPFVDGNGRLAREVMNLQARELLGLKDDPILDRGAAFYQALVDADAGNFEALELFIGRALEHAR